MEAWLREHPPSAEAFTQTLATAALRILDGESFSIAVRDFLDEYRFRPLSLRRSALAEDPPTTGDARYDAYLAAVAEHLSAADGLAAPDWVYGVDRFLERFWFLSEVPGFRAVQIVQSPAAFRRRGIFISADVLRTV